MKRVTGFCAAATLGALGAICAVALGASTQGGCTQDLTRINARFDELEQAITQLQTQSAQAASNQALANSNTQRELSAISSQVAGMSTTVVEISRRVR